MPAKKKMTIEDIMSNKVAVTKKIIIQIDGSMATQIEDLKREFNAAQEMNLAPSLSDAETKLEKKIEALKKKAKATEVVFEFKSIGRDKYDKLIDANPPTAQMKKEGISFHEGTFPPSLVAASCVQPKMTKDQAQEIFDSPDWNQTELLKLFLAAQAANTETGDIPLSKRGLGMTNDSVLSLIGQLGMESPTPST